ncbi:hypothetical protein BT092_03965 [Corynebacterium diphtheriae]|nr:hypothetical protein B1A57_02900 [Corynebacterium diphtheriae]PSA74126.1 hypothetical protein BT092_03965 [Corynebacterium diphtheriae]
MFMSVPAIRKDSGTSRWLRYGLFLSLSENDPGGDVAEGSDILKQLNRNLTQPRRHEVSQ